MPAPLPPSEDERRIVDVYRRAERALLATVAVEAGKTVQDPEHLPRGVRAVRAAAASVVRQLDVAAPGLYAEGLASATERGTRAAVDTLANLPGRDGIERDRNADPGVNLDALDRLAAAMVERTAEVHRTILRTTADRYRDALTDALPGGLVGTETRRDVTQRAVWRLADQGVTTFVDRSGRTWRASTYMEMATRTAMQRAEEDAKLDRLARAGVDLVIVQGGRDRCERCRPWNGLVLSITGQHAGTVTVPDAITGARQVAVHVAGTVADARAAGWGHPQCRCGLDRYQPGLTHTPPPVEREDNGQYAARQQQRAIERAIRAARERETAAIDKAAVKEAKAATRAAQARMRAHLADNPDLLRRSYREQIGAGNTPTAAQAARFADEAAAALPDVPAPPRVSQLRAGEVDDRMNAALAREDFDAFDIYAAESDRRQALRLARRDRDQRRRAERDDARAAELDQRLAGGQDEASAVEDVYGVTIETQRRQAAIASLRADSYSGRSFNDLSRAAYADHVADLYRQAEAATNGYLLTNTAEAKGIDPRALFIGSESRVRAHASPELREWFDQHGRPTLAEYRAELLDPAAAARMRNARGDFHT